MAATWAIITRFPDSQADNPVVWQVIDGVWNDAGLLSDAMLDGSDEVIMAVASPVATRCLWSELPDLEPKQAEGVARLRAADQSLGSVHSAARHLGDASVVTATIATDAMEHGLKRLIQAGLDPDIVIPAALAISPGDQIVRAEFDSMAWLRGPSIATPDEPVFRDLLIGQGAIKPLGSDTVRAMLLGACDTALVNLRQGAYAKRQQHRLATDHQRAWIKRLFAGLVGATALLILITLGKQWIATAAENDRALAAAQKIDAKITDVEQAEAQVDRALQQKGVAVGRFVPLSAGLWRALQASPNVSLRELRYGADGILTAVLAAPDANSANRALLAIQQDGYRITATPRQDTSGATLVDLTMRMP
jgi:general secretion pathway protein L